MGGYKMPFLFWSGIQKIEKKGTSLLLTHICRGYLFQKLWSPLSY